MSSWTWSRGLSSKMGPHVGLEPWSLVYTGSRQTGFHGSPRLQWVLVALE